jgi:hypothetical protein
VAEEAAFDHLVEVVVEVKTFLVVEEEVEVARIPFLEEEVVEVACCSAEPFDLQYLESIVEITSLGWRRRHWLRWP